MSNIKDKKTLSVTVKSITKVIFEGTATAVSSRNVRGPFDILPYHTNFISLINDGIVIQQERNKKVNIPLKSAVLKVHANRVVILIDIETS